MPAISIASPFQYFTNASGLALESGYIYIGTAGLPAESNPIPTYTNVGLTTTIAQPIRTSGGYAVSSGTPITIYVDALDYSITIRDKNETLVFSSLSAAGSIGVLPVAQGGTGASNQAGALLNLGALASSTVAKTANYTVVLTDRGESIFCNGTFTLSLTAAATLNDGFSFAVVNVGSGTVTINPNGSETIDGQATLALSQGQSCFVTTNGTEFRTLGLTGGQLPAFNLLANNTGATAAPVAISKADLYPQSFQVGGTVAANALTATLQPTPITFRSATAGSGSVTNLMVSTALSLTVPSGATLGATNGVAATLALAAINNAGTVELAIINLTSIFSIVSEGIISTTALSASSNSANTWYSTNARTNVPYKLVGLINVTQATAGTWASAPTVVQGYGIAQQAQTVINPLTVANPGAVWTNPTRTSGTTYTNTTANYRLVYVNLNASGGSTIVVGGVTIHNITNVQYVTISFLVPPGLTYVVTAATSITNWAELG